MRYFSNCFWLVVPVLALNLAFGGSLPGVLLVPSEAYPAWLGWIENALRSATVMLPVIMPLTLDRRGKTGLVVYSVGIALYALSWWPLFAAPEIAWSQSVIGLVAPAIAPAIWLAGIAIIGDRHFRFVPFPAGTYTLFSLAFIVAHVTRTGFVVS